MATLRAERGEKPYDAQLAITEAVIAATGPKANGRLAQIVPSLVRHLHEFAREVQLTTSEWMAAVELINESGRMSTDSRNETQLLCDIFGLESLVDDITSRLQTTQPNSPSTATPSAILGPFHRAGAPFLSPGSSLLVTPTSPSASWFAAAQSKLAFFTGRVLSAATGQAVAGAELDVWLSAPNGLYPAQDDSQSVDNLRGRLRADGTTGRYAFRALRPTPYPIAADGPAGRVLGLLDRSPWRPAHVHFIVTAPGYQSLTTQVFDAEGEFLGADSVFATKKQLVVRFEPLKDDTIGAKWRLDYDFILAPETRSGAGGD